MENNILLGATGDVVAHYDNSGVVQPGSSAAPSDTSVSQDGSSAAPDDTSVSQDQSSDSTNTGSNNLLMYAGAALLLYFFVFKKK